ncbi:hypothetical protein V2G26_014736 [Clonostachys chloroleuca]
MSYHVLLVGGHGKVAQYLTPLLLKRSWTVTSVIRTHDQVPTIQKHGIDQPGKLNVLVYDVEKISSKRQAGDLLHELKPDYIVWSAGAGGKGSPERTFRIDRDAAIHLIYAAAAIPTITRFLLISHNGSRQLAAPWWSPGEWEKFYDWVTNGTLANYFKAKLVADEELYRVSRESKTIIGISLRPATLTTKPAGKVTLGKTPCVHGYVSRESVARAADGLLAAKGIRNSWVDIYDGEEDLDEAVLRVVNNNVDAAEGDPVYVR